MAVYNFIPPLRIRANKYGLTYTTRLYTGNKPDHRWVLLPYKVRLFARHNVFQGGIALEWVQLV